MTTIFKKIIQEPLMHFVLLGSLIFVGYSIFATKVPSTENIVITKGEITSIKHGFALTRQRQPTNEELEGLIRDRIRQEVYRREAVALGLDKDDIIIQRRLQQKLEFIIGDNVVAEEPTNLELQDFLEKHPDMFKTEPRYSFKQVFLNPNKSGNSGELEAKRILGILNHKDADFQKLSYPSLLHFELSNASTVEISGGFGQEFVKQLDQLPVGKWVGPVKSSYGEHLVLIKEHVESKPPALTDVREAVIREWNNVRIREANELIYQKMLKNYTVSIEK
jgi:hypothetical protein